MLRIEDDGSKKTQSYSEETTLTLINVKHLTNGSVVFFFLTAFFCGFQRAKNNHLSYRKLHPSYEYLIKDLVKQK